MCNLIKKLFVLSICFGVVYAATDLESQLVQSSGKNQSIALWVNGVEDGAAQKAMEGVQNILKSDLAKSGEWSIVPVQYTEPSLDVLTSIQKAKHNVAVYLYVHTNKSNSADVDVFIYNLQQNEEFSQPVFVGNVHVPFTAYNGAAHGLANIIFKTLYGYPGNFLTKIAYVSEQYKLGMQPIYNLIIADYDGKRAVSILQSYSPILSLSWSPDAAKLAYALIENGRSILYIQDIVTGQRLQVTTASDFAVAPSWSYDGKTLLFSKASVGESHLYAYDVDADAMKKITSAPALDNEPVYAKHDHIIYFTSNRSGSTQIYKLDEHTGQAERVTFDGIYNASPKIINANAQLAMLHDRDGKLSIALFSPEKNEWQTITRDGYEESPSLAPSGRFVLFASRYAGRSILNIMSTDGLIRWRLPDLSGDVQEPAWSPMLSVAMYDQLSQTMQSKEG